MVARQNRPEHGTVNRRELDYSNMQFQFDFRFTEPKQWCNVNVVFDDSKEKSVHSGHISRVSISLPRDSVYLSDDKLGSMNLEVRNMRNWRTGPSSRRRNSLNGSGRQLLYGRKSICLMTGGTLRTSQCWVRSFALRSMAKRSGFGFSWQRPQNSRSIWFHRDRQVRRRV